MRRYWKSSLFSFLMILIAVFVVVNQKFSLGGNEIGSDAVLGLKLGLDLQGGSHLVYQSDLKNENGESIPPDKTQMQALIKTIERRVNSSGLGEPIIQLLGDDRLLIQLPGITDPERAKNLIGETARLEFKHRYTDASDPVDTVINEGVLTSYVGLYPTSTSEVDAKNNSTDKKDGEPDPVAPPLGVFVKFSENSYSVFKQLHENIVQSLESPGYDRLQVEVSGNDDVRRFELLGTFITETSEESEFVFMIPSNYYKSVEEAKNALGESPKFELLSILLGQRDEVIGLTGENLERAYPGQHQQTNKPIINIEFNEDGTRKFAELTTEIAGTNDRIAIFLDQDELISPVVNQPILGGAAFIDGPTFTIDRVNDLALMLESGRLPVPIKLLQERDVDAVLGADSLSKSYYAAGVGLLLVVVFMILYYRIPGLFASIALFFYCLLVIAVFKLLSVTLTLSGIAAAILSVGMAVDANILIFERLKEELRLGRTLSMAVNMGFSKAWPAIRDSNISTLITCLILFWFADQLGATIVKGFAVTLSIGVIISMISALLITQTILKVASNSLLSKFLNLYVPAGRRDVL
ncbi:MAG: protein translocase subunit SecD [SAR202 cluster bacterium]|nr:protein translocase subunit SecD [SAR202 cluster bacterium]